jgi:hypothetical protein
MGVVSLNLRQYQSLEPQSCKENKKWENLGYVLYYLHVEGECIGF